MENTTQQMPISKYGITERKKSNLDALQIEVLDAQYVVEQESSIVSSLTAKSVKFEGFLAVAEVNKEKALSNRNLVDTVVANSHTLKSNSEIAFGEMEHANEQMKEVAKNTKLLIDKLIFSAELINKLSNTVIRKKAQNPLISDELVSMVGTAGTDANNAVALTLVALKSTFASQDSNIESQAAAELEYKQSKELYTLLTGVDSEEKVSAEKLTMVKKVKLDTDKEKSIQGLLRKAYDGAKLSYKEMHTACNDLTGQLNSAQSKLDKAQVKLSSLKSGLAAANAAALA